MKTLQKLALCLAAPSSLFALAHAQQSGSQTPAAPSTSTAADSTFIEPAKSCREHPLAEQDSAKPEYMVRCITEAEMSTMLAIGGHQYPGVLLHVRVESELKSWNAKVGQAFMGFVDDAATLPDGTVIPKNSVVTGEVNAVAKHGGNVKIGAIGIFIESITLPDHTVIPVIARLKGGRTPYVAGSTSVGMPGRGLPGDANARSDRAAVHRDAQHRYGKHCVSEQRC